MEAGCCQRHQWRQEAHAAQDDDIPGIVRYRTYEVLAAEVDNPRLRWAYLPYSMHMAGPREAIQHMIIRRNYGCGIRLVLVILVSVPVPDTSVANSHREQGASCTALRVYKSTNDCTICTDVWDGHPCLWLKNRPRCQRCRRTQVHALHHRPGHGRQQEQPHWRGLLRRL